MQLYLGSTLREMKRYDEAKKLLLEAQKGVKDEVLPDLAQIAAATGDQQERAGLLQEVARRRQQGAAARTIPISSPTA